MVLHWDSTSSSTLSGFFFLAYWAMNLWEKKAHKIPLLFFIKVCRYIRWTLGPPADKKSDRNILLSLVICCPPTNVKSANIVRKLYKVKHFPKNSFSKPFKTHFLMTVLILSKRSFRERFFLYVNTTVPRLKASPNEERRLKGNVNV